jgi:deoxycytidylate deaminase
MCRTLKFSNSAYNISEFSQQKFKHGCVITKNSKVVTYGFNQGSRTKMNNKIRTCIHAEIDAAHKLIKILKKKHGRNYSRQLKKHTIWVVRCPNYKHEEIEFVESKPCYYCTKDLIEMGFEKIAYSNSKNEIVQDKLKNIENDQSHKSNLQKKIEKYF